MWTVGRCIVCTGIRLLLLICPFISSFFFLSNFQTLKFFVTLFSRTVRPRRLKLGSHMDSRQMYRCIPESGCCCLFVPLFLHFLSLQFSNIKIFHYTFIRNWDSQGELIVYQWSIICPLWSFVVSRRRRPHFQTWISLKPVGQSWSNFMCSITEVGERLHKVLGQIGSKLWFPCQQKAPIYL